MTTAAPDLLRPTRRSVLGAMAATTALAGCRSGVAGHLNAPAPAPTTSAPAEPSSRPGRLVVVYLRGGQDHLSTVIPHSEAAYHDARPTIAVPTEAALDLDGTFGLHPAMPGLAALYAEGRMAPVVATGNPAGDRSHFTAQDLSELGGEDRPRDGLGWLARHLRATESPDDAPFRGVGMGGRAARSLGGWGALGLPSLAAFGLGGSSGAAALAEDGLRLAHEGDGPVHGAGGQVFSAIDEAGELEAAPAGPSPYDAAFTDLATLLAADVGVEVATIDLGGWDTHDSMGGFDAGEMASLLGDLDTTLTGFQTRLDEAGLVDVTTVVMTEFGRRVAENGSGGTDHGWASAMLLLGGGVSGGQVHGEWPGVDRAAIGDRGDVPVATDFRDVLGDVVAGVLGGDPAAVFPDHEYTPVGVIG